MEDITARQAQIAADPSLGLRWSVVESLPVHEAIKLGEGDLDPLFDNYRQSLANLARCGTFTGSEKVEIALEITHPRGCERRHDFGGRPRSVGLGHGRRLPPDRRERGAAGR